MANGSATQHETVGQLVRTMRTRKGMTQKVLADAIGMSEQRVSQIETDYGDVTVKTLRRFAVGLDCVLRIELEPK